MTLLDEALGNRQICDRNVELKIQETLVPGSHYYFLSEFVLGFIPLLTSDVHPDTCVLKVYHNVVAKNT